MMKRFRLSGWLFRGEEGHGPYKISAERECTDSPMIFVYLIVVVGVVCLTAQCIIEGDMRTLFSDFDYCGNFCGDVTGKHPGINCSGADHRNRKYRITVPYKGRGNYNGNTSYPFDDDDNYNQTSRTEGNSSLFDDYPSGTWLCIESCDMIPNYYEYFGRCFPGEDGEHHAVFDDDFTDDLVKSIVAFAASICLSIVLSLVFVLLLKTHPQEMVWGAIVIWIIVLFVQLIYCFVNHESLMGVGFATLVALVSSISLAALLQRRIELVIELIRESGKAIGQMPLLVGIPLLNFFIMVIVYVVFFLIIFRACADRVLVYSLPNSLYYVTPIGMSTVFLSIFGWLWTLQFLVDCQNMAVAGAVALWFFTRKKEELRGPIKKSLYNLAVFHLGSVFFGSFIVAAVQFAKFIMKTIEDALKEQIEEEGKPNECAVICLELCQICTSCLEDCLIYINRNAYIEIAIHGYSFFKAGKRAVTVIFSNLLDVIAINTAGDLVLNCIKTLVVYATGLVAWLLLQISGVSGWNVAIMVTICMFIAGVFAHCFISIYEMVIDSMFICYCEDKEWNDGSLANPYFMSKNLMQFVKKTQELLKEDPGPWQKVKNFFA